MSAQNAHADRKTAKELTQKSCGDCTLCCKVNEVEDIGKKAGHSCHNLRENSGCGVWGIHPKACQTFTCLWVKHDALSAQWRPDISGLVLKIEENGAVLTVDVDPDRPDAWLNPLYYSQLKAWSEGMLTGEGLVRINTPRGVVIVTPNEDLYLRIPKRGEVVEAGIEPTLFGLLPYARIVAAKASKSVVFKKAA